MYEDMSDFDVNKRLAELLGYKVKRKHLPLLDCWAMWKYGGAWLPLKDYCNSWADIGPLIIEYKVTITQDTEAEYPEDPHACIIGHYSAGGHMGIFEFCGEHVSQAKTPLRAAAICILKKLESETKD